VALVRKSAVEAHFAAGEAALDAEHNTVAEHEHWQAVDGKQPSNLMANPWLGEVVEPGNFGHQQLQAAVVEPLMKQEPGGTCARAPMAVEGHESIPDSDCPMDRVAH